MSLRSKAKTALTLGKAFMKAEHRRQILPVLEAYRAVPPARCICCGFEGRFWSGVEVVIGSVCPGCGSLERHRLVALAAARKFVTFDAKKVLHFAPETALSLVIGQANPAAYVTADIQPGMADIILDIENIAMPDEGFDIVVASHVLEHVDDARALAEIHRILRPDGLMVAMAPVVEGWETTFEDSDKTSSEDRERYFGKSDHLRYYGADLRGRIRAAGFSLSEYTAGPVDSVDFRLLRGEKLFLGRK